MIFLNKFIHGTGLMMRIPVKIVIFSKFWKCRYTDMAETTRILGNLVKKNPWLNVCMRDCREANIGKEHSKNYIFDKSANIPIRNNLSNFNID